MAFKILQTNLGCGYGAQDLFLHSLVERGLKLEIAAQLYRA